MKYSKLTFWKASTCYLHEHIDHASHAIQMILFINKYVVNKMYQTLDNIHITPSEKQNKQKKNKKNKTKKTTKQQQQK